MKEKIKHIISVILSVLQNKFVLYTIILAGILFKLLLFPVKLGDYNVYLEPWINFIKSHGYFYSLQYDFYNYTPPYIYILIVLAKLGFNPLYSIKIVSVIFEYVLAFYVGKIAYQKYLNKKIILISLAVLPLIPTVILNGAFWGQCDVIYSTFAVMSFYFLIQKKNLLSVIFLGIAFAFKAQTAFILPLFFLFFIQGKIKWYYFLIIPLVYLIAVCPAWLFGRNLMDLFTIYAKQSDYFQGLTLYFPNIYVWFSDDYYTIGKISGIILTILITIIFCFWLKKQNIPFDLEILVQIALLSVIITPFFLPGMHERYLFLGDIFAVLYFLIRRKNIHISIGIITVSFYAYMSCSRLKEILPLWPAFFVYAAVIILLFIDLKKIIEEKKYQLEN